MIYLFDNLRFCNAHTFPFTTRDSSNEIITNLVYMLVAVRVNKKKGSNNCVDGVAKAKDRHCGIAQMLCVYLKLW